MNAVAVSLGDPAGIGPEIVVKAWAQRTRHDLPAFEVHGDRQCIARMARALGVEIDALPVRHVPLAVQERTGEPDPRNGPAIVEAIVSAVAAARSGRCSAVVTCPIAKGVLYESGFAFPGHTEFIADLCAAPHDQGPLMLLAAADLRVALVSVHQPLRAVAPALTQEAIVRAGSILHRALRRDFGVDAPRIALAGLNPHAGEGGALGREEIDIVNPAAAQLRAQGVTVTDAQAPDAMFHAGARKGYDAALCLYHDQGLIPIKTLDFWGGVNMTLGLPIVRTSPDHGTAFDIAGKNAARPDSFIAALRLASEVAGRRARADA